MILITIVHGVYKPTNITGGPHLVEDLNCFGAISEEDIISTYNSYNNLYIHIHVYIHIFIYTYTQLFLNVTPISYSSKYLQTTFSHRGEPINLGYNYVQHGHQSKWMLRRKARHSNPAKQRWRNHGVVWCSVVWCGDSTGSQPSKDGEWIEE